MPNEYPLIDPRNVGRFYGLHPAPGPVEKSGILMAEGYSATPQVRWEHRIDNGYPNVFYDDDYQEYRCYYTACITDIASTVDRPEDRATKAYDFSRRDLYPPRVAGILLATSKDGARWTRPDLGIVAHDGDAHNNILMKDVHGASVFKDAHEKDPERRYKMVTRHDKHHAMAVSFSADGIHWQAPIDWPDHNPAGDTHNFAFWDASIQRYVLITRTWDWDSLRLCARCESEDFLHWTRPVEIYRGNGFDDQIYSMPVFQQGDLYIGLASLFHGGDRASDGFDCVDVELTVSDDGLNWNRPAYGQPFIPRGQGRYGSGIPDAGCIYASIPVERDGDYQFYYFGGTGQHTNFRESHLMRATVKKNRLTGYRTDGKAGWLETKAVTFAGDTLYAIADVGAGGSLKAAIGLAGRTFYEDLRPLDGFGADDCAVTRQGDGDYAITFRGGALPRASNEPLAIAFYLKDAMLYGYGGDLTVRRHKIDAL